MVLEREFDYFTYITNEIYHLKQSGESLHLIQDRNKIPIVIFQL